MFIEPICDALPSADLATHEICAEVEWLMAVAQRADSRLCDHLAELADRFDRHAPELSTYASIYQFARQRFGLSVRAVRERVRIGRALRGLPLIARAFVSGRLGYAKVREVTRVSGLAQAGPDGEAMWLATACAVSLRELERRVAEAARGDGETRSTDVRSADARSVQIRFNLPMATWELLERAMDGARQEAGLLLSDAQALEAIANAALASQAARAEAAGDPRDRAPMTPWGHGRAMTPRGHDDPMNPRNHDGAMTPGGHDGAMTPGGHWSEAGLSPEGATVLKAMSTQTSWHPDEIHERTKLKVSEIFCALTELELNGLVYNGIGGYQRVRPPLHA